MGTNMNNNELIMGYLIERQTPVKKTASKNLTESRKLREDEEVEVTGIEMISDIIPEYISEYTNNASVSDVKNVYDSLKNAGFEICEWDLDDESGETWTLCKDNICVTVKLDGNVMEIFVDECDESDSDNDEEEDEDEGLIEFDDEM